MRLRYLYRLAAGCFLATIALLAALELIASIIGQENVAWLENPPFLVRLPLGILGVACAVGIISLWFGMMWDCLFVNKLSTLSKVGWFLLLLLTNMLGALIYYYAQFQKREPGISQ
jgi:hypothetical protein